MLRNWSCWLFCSLIVTAIYTDGTTARVLAGGYTVSSDVVAVIGSNVYTVTVTYGENIFNATFVVVGVKNLALITAKYDGKPVAIGQAPERRDIIITAYYTDQSQSVVSDWKYTNGEIVTAQNNGVLTIYYEGFTAQISIPYYTSTASQLIAFYNGPNVEVGTVFDPKYLSIKIYYTSPSGENNRYEAITEGYILSTQNITFEGNNIIEITYDTDDGILKTTFTVYGFRPEKEIVYITGTYTGPPVAVGKAYNQEKIICKAFYNDNSISTVKDFTVTKTVIDTIGVNQITIAYKTKQCIVTITGIDPETTTDPGYNPVSIDLNYPEAAITNHRYRGPMESQKVNNYNLFLNQNITELYKIFNTLEGQYKSLCETATQLSNTGSNTLNACSRLTDTINKWKTDKRFYEEG